jgi:hypothetical protein
VVLHVLFLISTRRAERGSNPAMEAFTVRMGRTDAYLYNSGMMSRSSQKMKMKTILEAEMIDAAVVLVVTIVAN